MRSSTVARPRWPVRETDRALDGELKRARDSALAEGRAGPPDTRQATPGAVDATAERDDPTGVGQPGSEVSARPVGQFDG